MAKTIQEVLDQMNDYMDISTNLAFSSKKKYSKIIRLFLLFCGMKFNGDTINRFITEKNKNKNNYNYKYAFKYFLESIGQKKLYEGIKASKKKSRKKIFRHIPKEVLQNIINLLPNKYKTMAVIQLKTGCRFIELSTLRAENIDFELSPDIIGITVGSGLSKSKGQKERKLILHRKYESLLRTIIKKPYGYIFLDPKFEHYDEEKFFSGLETVKRYYNRELSKAGNRLNIEHLSSHYLRHLFADYYLLAGGTAESLMKIMGHVKMDTTLVYVSVSEEMAQKTILKMG